MRNGPFAEKSEDTAEQDARHHDSGGRKDSAMEGAGRHDRHGRWFAAAGLEALRRVFPSRSLKCANTRQRCFAPKLRAEPRAIPSARAPEFPGVRLADIEPATRPGSPRHAQHGAASTVRARPPEPSGSHPRVLRVKSYLPDLLT